jgi:hypothetical protein
MTDLAAAAYGHDNKRLHYHSSDRQGTLDSVDSNAAFFPRVENGPTSLPMPVQQHPKEEGQGSTGVGVHRPSPLDREGSVLKVGID